MIEMVMGDVGGSTSPGGGSTSAAGGAVGGSTDGSDAPAGAAGGAGGTADQVVGPDQPLDAEQASSDAAPAPGADADWQTATDISKPARDRKAPLGESKTWTKPVFQEPDMSDWTDDAKERWDLLNPKGDRPVATGEVLDDDTNYGYEKPQVEVEVGRNRAGEPVTVQKLDLAPAADDYHQSPTPDRSQVNGDGERLLAKFMGSEYQTRMLLRDEIRSQIGADVDYDVVWSAENNFTVDITDFPEELQQYIIVGDGLFAVTRVAPAARGEG